MKEVEHLIKITLAKIPIENPLELGQDVTIILKGNVTRKSEEDNQDGTKDIIYSVKGLIGDIVPQE